MIKHERLPLGDDAAARAVRSELNERFRGLSVRPHINSRFGQGPRQPIHGQCAAAVADHGRGAGFHQCTRTAKVSEMGFGWCGQHAPSKVRAKQEKRDARWRAESAARDARATARRAEQELKETALAALKEIARGELNDPAGYATMILADHGVTV